MINNNLTYICNETLAEKLDFFKIEDFDGELIELIDSITLRVNLIKL